MSKRGGSSKRPRRPRPAPQSTKKREGTLTDLASKIADGDEYRSVVAMMAGYKKIEFIPAIRETMNEIETIRGRPLLVYAGSVIRGSAALTSIAQEDQLPFCEMVGQIDPDQDSVDLLLSSPGGRSDVVERFVDALRPRFKNVDVILPSLALSAGTLLALAGNEIWMDSRAYMGPLDPQVPGKDGQYLPAQALEVLVSEIQKRGAEKVKKGEQPNWTDIAMLRNVDLTALGHASTATRHVIDQAARYLVQHKFRDWPKPDDEKERRARKIATLLCSHERWKDHATGISRDAAWSELELKIRKPEEVDGLQRAIRRCWCLIQCAFEATGVRKVMVGGKNYSLMRQETGK